MIVTVHVAVALSRPPRVDEWRRIRVLAGSEVEASLVACQIASCTSVMAVACEVVDVDEI